MKRPRQTVLWILSILLGSVFIAVGLSKLEGSSATRWAERFLRWGYPAGSQYVIGTIEAIAGIAMMIPRSRKTAAGIIMVVMAGALYTHASHGEFPRVIPPLVLGSLAFLVLLLHSQASTSGK
jgi:putative oxidoreductase